MPSRIVHRRYLGTSSAPPPQCTTDTSISYGVETISSSDKVTQRRPRPKPLYQNPTSLGPYTRYLYVKPVHRVITSFYCGGTRYVVSPYSVDFTVPLSPQAMPPWQNELNSRIKQERVNLASDMAEFGKTVDMAVDVAEELAKFGKNLYKAARFAKNPFRGVGMSTARQLKSGAYRLKEGGWANVPASYLLSTYALEPMLGSLYDSLVALQNPASERPILRKIRFRTRAEYEPTITDTWGQRALTGRVTHRTSMQTTAIIQLKANRGLWKDNFTPGNPLEWAWELVPFSFMVDWFIPIGKTLTALDAYEGVAGIWGTNTTRVQVHASNVQSRGTQYTKLSGVFHPGSLTYEYYRREAFTSAVGTVLPTYSPSPGIRKLINASAILTQLRNRP